MPDDLYSRVLGCVVGGAIGDAFGAPVEFRSAEDLHRMIGTDWVDRFLPYGEGHKPHPLGVWRQAPPRGTGTDDTRNNHVFLECVIRNAGEINSTLLAMEYVRRYRDRETFYPGHADFAERQFRDPYEFSCARLGMERTPSGRPAWVTLARGNSFPTLHGLISLAFAGCLCPGEPEEAYKKAFELAFLDLGYARDATAMMAAMVSAGLGGEADARAMIEVGLETDPFGFGRRIMVERIRQFLEIADAAPNDRAMIDALSARVRHLHPFDPIDVLGVPVAALLRSGGDPVRTVVMAANDRDLDEEGKLVQLRDVDCTAGVAGALAGALSGAEAWPADWVADAVEANKDVYGIDLEANTRRFCQAVYGGR